MKNLKITLLALTVLAFIPTIGMEQASQSKTMDVDAQSYLMNLPGDLQREIIRIIATSSSSQTAVDAIRALTKVNKRYYTLINDENATDSLITLLADKWFGGNRVLAAFDLKTAGAKKWFSTLRAQKWFKEYFPKNADVVRWDFGFLLRDGSPFSRTQAKLLLKLGFIPNAAQGSQAVFMALKNNDLELFNVLLQAGVDPNARDINTTEHILEKAAFKRNLEAIDLLLAAGADPNPRDRNGQSLIQRFTELSSINFGGRPDPYYKTLIARLQAAQAKEENNFKEKT